MNRFGWILLLLAAYVMPAVSQTIPFAITSPVTLPAADVCVAANGVMCSPYSFTFASNAGQAGVNATPPVTWSLNSLTLPTGMSISSAGVLSGIATSIAGYYGAFLVGAVPSNSTATTPIGTSALIGMNLNVQPSITTTSLPSGNQGVPYPVMTLTGTGGTPPYTWSSLNNSLPAGFALSPTGTLSGPVAGPTTAGIFQVVVKMTDSAGTAGNGATSITQTFPLTIVGALGITSTASLPTAEVNVPYSFTFSGIGGQPSYSWSVSSGTTPPGLALNTYSGVLVGTPTTNGTYPFVITLTDIYQRPVSQSVSLAVLSLPQITTTSLPQGIVGNSYTAALAATGGTTPYHWAVSAGSMPTGLSLNPQTGAISGIPTGPPGTSSITFSATDSATRAQSATQVIGITIGAPTLSITTTALPPGISGLAYSSTLAAQGGTLPYNWSITAGSLPAGLSLNSASGVITGMPSTTGSFAFTVQLKDSSTPAQTATRAFSIVANAALTILPTSVSNGTKGLAYSYTFVAQNGTPPYTWSITSGALPAGLSLNPATGAVTGTPTATGVYAFAVKVSDGGSPSQSATQSYENVSIVVGLTILTSGLPNGTAGLQYSATLSGQSGTPPYKWSIGSGSLPSGVSLDAATGAITGMPTTPGTFPVTIVLTDSSTLAQSASEAISLFINPPETAPTIPTFTLTGLPPSQPPKTSIVNGSIQLSPVSSAAYSGQLGMTFTPNAQGVSSGYAGDASFLNSANNVEPSPITLMIPAGATNVALPTINPGTVAGDITLTLTVANQDVASSVITVEPLAPIIEAGSVHIEATSTGFDVELVATSTTREITAATFTFTAASGAQLAGTTTLTPSYISSLLTQWFASNDGLTYGGAFSLVIPFTLSGPLSAIQSVSVTLANSLGTSAAVTGTQ